MKKLIASLLVLICVALAPTASSVAGSRYYSHSYSNHYYGGYRSHYYPYSHHRRYYHHSDDHFLSYLGVGLLAGAVVGSVLYQPPVQRTVVYSTPPPVIVHRNPVMIEPPRSEYYSDSEVLRQIKPTVRILNLRSGPGLDEEVIGQATYGEILGVIGAAPEWLYVKTQTGLYGWVMTRYTQAMEGPVG